LCLNELSDDPLTKITPFQYFFELLSKLVPPNSAMLQQMNSFFNHSFGVRGVSTASCDIATRWRIGQNNGGNIISETSNLCLEVSRFIKIAIIQGKRVQTAPCNYLTEKVYFDFFEHQAWTTPNDRLLNLYQRQCLTVDRDAFPGVVKEVWSGPLSNHSHVVLLFNKGYCFYFYFCYFYSYYFYYCYYNSTAVY
jgi:hypothetical protein